MKITGGKIYALRIPFVEAFAHAAKNRKFSDSFVVRLTAADGTFGYGEGAARPYVTGETVETGIEHIKTRLFPAIKEHDFPEIETGLNPLKSLQPVTESLPAGDSADRIVWNAARAAVESAIIDCLLKSQKISLGALLPPKRPLVTYSGVITSGTMETALQHARRFKLFNLKQIKIKIGSGDDVARVEAIRRVVGSEISLRVDANGAFDLRGALEIAEKLAAFDIAAIEQPIPRGTLKEWTELTTRSAILVMADESLITVADAQELVENSACDYFNLRVSKCGGIAGVLKIAEIARKNRVRLQLGCQVGETAILSAAGRHVAAFLDDAEFVEGSFGSLLLAEDVSRNSVNFGHGGRAPLLRAAGLGIEVRDPILEKYAHSVIKLGEEKAFYA